MAGRYDSNPFEEEEVNPFSVCSSFHLLLVKVLIFSTGCQLFLLILILFFKGLF